MLPIFGGLLALGGAQYLKDKYTDARAGQLEDRRRQQVEGLLGSQGQYQLPPDQMGPQIQGSGLLGGGMQDKEFAARLMTIPGYEKIGASLFDSYTNPATNRPYFTPIQTSSGFYSFDTRSGNTTPIGLEGGGVALPVSADPKKQAEVAGAKTTAEETARANVGRSAAATKKADSAVTALDLISQAEQLLPVATGSPAGKAVDALAGFGGVATPGAQAAASLKVIAGNLKMMQPRMEGPQSDKDVQLYNEMVGQLGDEGVPIETRLSALKTIKELQQKYASSAPAGGSPPSKRKKFNPATGMIE